MNTARNGRNIKNSTHRVLVTPDTEWSRNRSVKTWNKTMSQMNKKKNHNTDQKMSPNETSATIMVSSLSRWAKRNKHRGRGADSAVATHPERVTTGHRFRLVRAGRRRGRPRPRSRRCPG